MTAVPVMGAWGRERENITPYRKINLFYLYVIKILRFLKKCKNDSQYPVPDIGEALGVGSGSVNSIQVRVQFSSIQHRGGVVKSVVLV